MASAAGAAALGPAAEPRSQATFSTATATDSLGATTNLCMGIVVAVAHRP